MSQVSPVARLQPRGLTIAGWVLSTLFILFMVFDVGIKLIGRPEVAETLTGLGWPAGAGFAIGVIELIALVFYVVPQTSVLGAVLMTAVMGGAIATNWRAGSPLVSHTLFGVYLGVILWGGLWLRSPALRALMPWRG